MRRRRPFSSTARNRIDASFFGDPSHGDTGPQRTSSLLKTDTSGFSTLDYGGHQQTVKYDGVMSSSFLVEGSFARSLNKISELPSVNTWQVTDTRVVPNIVSGGIGSYEQGNVSDSKQWSVKATNIVGGHQVKYGIQYDDVTYQQLNQRTGPTFLAADGRQTATGASIQIIPDVSLGQIYRVTRANFNVSRDIPQTYVNFFAQDTWRVGDRLTINPGIRYEQEKMSGTIIKDWSLKNNWAPRIGAAYDMSGDGRTKLYGNYGIFYARIPLDLAARALSADDGFTRGDYLRCEPDAADSDGRSDADARSGSDRDLDDVAFHPGGRRARIRSIRTPSCRTRPSSCSASSARSCANDDVRRAVRAPRPCRASSKTWRTARWRRTNWRRPQTSAATWTTS